MKPQKALDLEAKLTSIFAKTYPDVKVNIFKMEDEYFKADVVSAKFTGSWIQHHTSLTDIMDKNGYDNMLYTLLPVTPEDFSTARTGPEWYEEGEDEDYGRNF
jgi:hypothetical protein